MLTNTEEILLELLSSRGTLGAGHLAKLSKIKRPTVYAALENLSRIGFVFPRSTKIGTRFSAQPAHIIERLISEEADRKAEEEKRFGSALGARLLELQKRSPQKIAGYEVSALDAPNVVPMLLEQALMNGNFCAIFNPQLVMKGEIKKLVQRCLNEAVKRKPPIRELCVPGPEFNWYQKEIKNPNHQIKVLPQTAHNLVTDMILFDGAVILLTYGESGEMAIRIKQSQFYGSMLLLFETLWQAE